MFTYRILPLVIYFSTGFFIPVLSRFLMKFYPCSLHSYVGDILKYYFNKKQYKQKHNNKTHNILKKRYLLNKMLWGTSYLVLFSSLRFLIESYISKSFPLILLFIFLFLLGFSANIDKRCKIIPDIITYPLLMVAFLTSVICEKNHIVTPLNISIFNSIYSTIYAYILCFTLALIFYFKNPYSFGGGDVKLITAVSAFVGVENLGIIFMISFILSLINTMIKKDKYFALAPFVFAAFIIFTFAKILLYI